MLIDSNGHVQLSGFELALSIHNGEKLVELPATISVDLASYMAPEVLKCEGIIRGCESKIDYFSLGCVLLEMCTGKSPIQNNMINGSPRVPWLMKKELKFVIQGLLTPNPLKRFGNNQIKASSWLHDVSSTEKLFLITED